MAHAGNSYDTRRVLQRLDSPLLVCTPFYYTRARMFSFTRTPLLLQRCLDLSQHCFSLSAVISPQKISHNGSLLSLQPWRAHFHTSRSAPLLVGGIPDTENKRVKYAIKLPGMLSFLAHGDFGAEVTGLDKIPVNEHPPVPVVHYAFQIMVGCGLLLISFFNYLFDFAMAKEMV
jgi:hypothetical protein